MKLWVPPSMFLRDVRDDDHAWLVALHNDPVVLKNLTNPSHITMDEHMAWWERTKNDPRERRFIFTVDDNRVGFTKFYSIDRANSNCVLGADIHCEHRGKGLAKYMWSLMLEQAFVGWGLHRVSLTTAEFNHIAQGIYQRLGFQVEGRLVQSLQRHGSYFDQIGMYMLRDAWVSNEVEGE